MYSSVSQMLKSYRHHHPGGLDRFPGWPWSAFATSTVVFSTRIVEVSEWFTYCLSSEPLRQETSLEKIRSKLPARHHEHHIYVYLYVKMIIIDIPVIREFPSRHCDLATEVVLSCGQDRVFPLPFRYNVRSLQPNPWNGGGYVVNLAKKH